MEHHNKEEVLPTFVFVYWLKFHSLISKIVEVKLEYYLSMRASS